MSQQLILAIGRESGSGGLDIARLLAERFDLPLYDKNILQTAAQERGVSPEKLTRYDEQPRSPLFYRSIRGYSNAPEDAVAQLQFRLLTHKSVFQLMLQNQLLCDLYWPRQVAHYDIQMCWKYDYIPDKDA